MEDFTRALSLLTALCVLHVVTAQLRRPKMRVEPREILCYTCKSSACHNCVDEQYQEYFCPQEWPHPEGEVFQNCTGSHGCLKTITYYEIQGEKNLSLRPHNHVLHILISHKNYKINFLTVINCDKYRPIMNDFYWRLFILIINRYD